jgi:hypothetical protein
MSRKIKFSVVTLLLTTALAQPAVGSCGGGSNGKPNRKGYPVGTVVDRHPNARGFETSGWILDVKPYGKDRVVAVDLSKGDYNKCDINEEFPSCLG